MHVASKLAVTIADGETESTLLSADVAATAHANVFGGMRSITIFSPVAGTLKLGPVAGAAEFEYQDAAGDPVAINANAAVSVPVAGFGELQFVAGGAVGDDTEVAIIIQYGS